MPARMPTVTYSRVNFQPNSPHNRTTAISLTRGEVIRNARVTPKGIRAMMNPINRGMLEQEQKGVTAPNPAPNA